MMSDPLADLKNYKPEPIDLSGLTERVLTDAERRDLIKAASDARSNKEFLAAALGTILKIGGKLIA